MTGGKSHLSVDHTDKIQLDPECILSPKQKTSFRRLCQEFSDVIRPEPGRYNGSLSHISNRINFASRPAPNAKIYQQNLTEEMKRKLGDKMDKLLSWGVLQFPEHLGVKPEFISPSMIIPKQEKNEFRLVTNFSSLNKFIKKPRGTSPTIQEAKDFLARHRLHIHLDLANFSINRAWTETTSSTSAPSTPSRALSSMPVRHRASMGQQNITTKESRGSFTSSSERAP